LEYIYSEIQAPGLAMLRAGSGDVMIFLILYRFLTRW